MSLGALTEALSPNSGQMSSSSESALVLPSSSAITQPWPRQPVQSTSQGVDAAPRGSPQADAETARAIRELLELLPKDVVADLNSGKIDVHDPAFLDGLTDHVARLSLADPREGRRVVGKIIKLKKRIARDLRASDPSVVVSSTISRSDERVGRNDRCPCGSGKKFKQCCMRKA